LSGLIIIQAEYGWIEKDSIINLKQKENKLGINLTILPIYSTTINNMTGRIQSNNNQITNNINTNTPPLVPAPIINCSISVRIVLNFFLRHSHLLLVGRPKRKFMGFV